MNFSGRRSDGTVIAKDKQGKPLNGLFFGQSSFSRLAVVHPSCAVKVEVEDRDDLRKLVIGCAIQTGAGSILNVCRPAVDSSILIFGCGGVGLSAVMAAKLASPRHLIAVDMNPDKLEHARKFGASDVIDASNEDVPARIKAITLDRGVDFALDCVGSPAILKTGLDALALHGTLVTVGGTPQDFALSPVSMLQRGLTYRGCHQGDSVPRVMIPKLIHLSRRGLLPFQELFQYYRFDEYERALHDLKSGKCIKPVLLF